MPETISKYKIFIASPSDLNEERKSIDEVVAELNLSFGQQNNLVIELCKWETHSAPGISQKDSQAIINDDIGNYDIFIGLLWQKFGTPTTDAGSGTEEEFNIAKRRFDDNPESLQILFYFKDSAPKSLSSINPEQLQKVNDFKKRLGKEKVLYWTFDTIENLHSFLRIHIPKRINTLKDKNKTKAHTKIIPETKLYKTEDFGLLDYQNSLQSKFNDSAQSLLNISTATNWIADRMKEKTAEVAKLNSIRKQLRSKELYNICYTTSQYMNDYASRIDVEIPIFFNHIEEGIKAMSSIINLVDEFYNETNISELESSKEEIITLSANIITSNQSLSEFRESVNQLPRLTKELNRAKRNVTERLDDLSLKMLQSSNLSKEIIKEISEKIDRIKLSFALDNIK